MPRNTASVPTAACITMPLNVDSYSLLITPTKTPSTTAYPTIAIGLVIRANVITRTRTRPAIIDPNNATEYAAGGRNSHDTAATAPTIPSNPTARITTSSIVIGPTRGGAVGWVG